MPVDTVNRIVPQIISRGKPARPGIGVSVAAEEFAAQLGVDGVVIIEAVSGGPAAGAGLRGIDRRTEQLGDVIVAVDGVEVFTAAQLSAELDKAGVGKPVTLTVERDGQRREVTLDTIDIG